MVGLLDSFLVALDLPELVVDSFLVALDLPELAVDAFLVALDLPELAVDSFLLSLDLPELAVDSLLVALDLPELAVDSFLVALDLPVSAVVSFHVVLVLALGLPFLENILENPFENFEYTQYSFSVQPGDDKVPGMMVCLCPYPLGTPLLWAVRGGVGQFVECGFFDGQSHSDWVDQVLGSL